MRKRARKNAVQRSIAQWILCFTVLQVVARGKHSPNPLIRQYFDENGVGNSAVDNEDFFNATANGFDTAIYFGNHTTADNALAD